MQKNTEEQKNQMTLLCIESKSHFIPLSSYLVIIITLWLVALYSDNICWAFSLPCFQYYLEYIVYQFALKVATKEYIDKKVISIEYSMEIFKKKSANKQKAGVYALCKSLKMDLQRIYPFLAAKETCKYISETDVL